MPLTTDPPFELPVLDVEPWSDPVIDELGVDPRGAYTERFWLPVLGPSTVLFLRQVADRLDDQPDGFSLDLTDAARSLGVGMRGGRNAPIMKTVERSCRFGAAQMHGRTTLAVRRRLAPLNRSQVERLPERLQAEHGAWLTRPTAVSQGEQLRERARRLALSLLELGETPEACERQLHAWRFHPAIAFDALRWARATHAANAGLIPGVTQREDEAAATLQASDTSIAAMTARRVDEIATRATLPSPDAATGEDPAADQQS